MVGDELQSRWGCSLAGGVGTTAMQGSALALLENKGGDRTMGFCCSSCLNIECRG